jgi:isoamylase
MKQKVKSGRSYPLGATLTRDGTNFSLYSRNAEWVELLLFDAVDDDRPAQVVRLDPETNKTFHYWHVELVKVRAGQFYGYRIGGPESGEFFHSFDPDKLVLDPYARAVAVPEDYNHKRSSQPGPVVGAAHKGVVTDARGYDWEGDKPPRHSFTRTVIYEMHPAGFTRHPNSKIAAKKRGTYAGLIEKIPYLKDLGVTTVELLPVFHFDPQDAPEGRINYWGYSPLSFFAPHPAYSCSETPLGVLNEFRDMIKAMHRAGIEVILDVVYNHTGEGDKTGPVLSFKGIDNAVYYLPGPEPHTYANFSGCGNTLNTNHSVVRRMIIDSLRYWVQVMHVDGFRFDLASILARDEDGTPLSNPPVLWQIETDPVLAGSKLIAEAWDAGGLYQVGSFVGDRWREWNGRFRDDVRRFMKADSGSVVHLPQRFLASPDIFGHEKREPEQSINFVTCHDGFTLNDLVSYSFKHNEGNGENNRDGENNNYSWNCGVEGPTDDPHIEALRLKQIKNFLAITLLSVGMPMLSMGDEVRRTQHGNNNAYCQDNEIGWMDWSLLKKNSGLHRFVKEIIKTRLSLELFSSGRERTLDEFLEESVIRWHGIELDQPDWSPNSHSLAFTVEGNREHLHLIFNSFWEDLEFQLPGPPTAWNRLVDTSLESPNDIVERGDCIHCASKYLARARSCVLLLSPR